MRSNLKASSQFLNPEHYSHIFNVCFPIFQDQVHSNCMDTLNTSQPLDSTNYDCNKFIQLMNMHTINIKLSLFLKHFIRSIIYKGSIIHYFRQFDIITYNPINKQIKTTTLKAKINDCANTVSFDNKIFAIGGNLISDVNEIDFENKTLIPKQNMKHKKYGSPLCADHGYIYCIGGYDGCCLPYCEEYNVADDKWKDLPNLLSPRFFQAVFIFNKNYIYCCCGYQDHSHERVNTIERLTLKGLRWENIHISSPLSPRERAVGLQINNKQAMVLGGNDNDACKDCYCMNIYNDHIECVRSVDLVASAVFYQSSSPILINGCIFSVDNDKHIHEYQIPTGIYHK